MRFRSALLTTALVLGAVVAANAGGLITPAYAPLNSPAFVGTPTVPTAPTGTNTTQAASTAFAAAAVGTETTRATGQEAAISARIPAASTSATPTLLCGGNAPTSVTYTVQTMKYVQVGPEVDFIADVEWSALSCTGAVTIAGLPSGSTLSPDLILTGYGVTANTTPYGTVATTGAINILTTSPSTAPASDAAMTGAALASAGALKTNGRFFVN